MKLLHFITVCALVVAGISQAGNHTITFNHQQQPQHTTIDFAGINQAKDVTAGNALWYATVKHMAHPGIFLRDTFTVGAVGLFVYCCYKIYQESKAADRKRANVLHDDC